MAKIYTITWGRGAERAYPAAHRTKMQRTKNAGRNALACATGHCRWRKINAYPLVASFFESWIWYQIFIVKMLFGHILTNPYVKYLAALIDLKAYN